MFKMVVIKPSRWMTFLYHPKLHRVRCMCLAWCTRILLSHRI